MYNALGDKPLKISIKTLDERNAPKTELLFKHSTDNGDIAVYRLNGSVGSDVKTIDLGLKYNPLLHSNAAVVQALEQAILSDNFSELIQL